jgi:hypothetical protein
MLLALCCVAAAAQQRDIPADAKRGRLTHVYDMQVQIDEQPQRLAPGARIRDADNRIVVPMSVPPKSDVKYRLDQAGYVREVWILTPAEAAPAEKP